jgi:hypothetical protein
VGSGFSRDDPTQPTHDRVEILDALLKVRGICRERTALRTFVIDERESGIRVMRIRFHLSSGGVSPRTCSLGASILRTDVTLNVTLTNPISPGWRG